MFTIKITEKGHGYLKHRQGKDYGTSKSNMVA